MIKIGQVIQNKYRIDQVIGTGGMGVVYQVWVLTRNVPLAMKVLNTDVNDVVLNCADSSVRSTRSATVPPAHRAILRL